MAQAEQVETCSSCSVEHYLSYAIKAVGEHPDENRKALSDEAEQALDALWRVLLSIREKSSNQNYGEDAGLLRRVLKLLAKSALSMSVRSLYVALNAMRTLRLDRLFPPSLPVNLAARVHDIFTDVNTLEDAARHLETLSMLDVTWTRIDAPAR
jgi:hypothetical protein